MPIPPTLSANHCRVAAAQNVNCPLIDQRGFPRDDGACDVGAYEAGAEVIFTDGFESGGISARSNHVP